MKSRIIRNQTQEILEIGSYLEQFISQHYTSYPDTGWPGYVYSGAFNYTAEDLEKLDSLSSGMDSYEEDGRLIKVKQN